jgi:hypothetical protein
MSHHKRRPTAKTIGRDFPFVVEIPVPRGGLGKCLDSMHDFHAQRGIAACIGRGRGNDGRICLRWYFSDHAKAVSFAVEFDGKLVS